MNILRWLDERTGFCTAFKKVMDWKVPAGKCYCRFMPVSLVFLFLLQALTGAFLWAFYSPSATSAWESVFYIQYVLPFGWLLRGIHHFSAQLFVGIAGLYLLATILHGSYRRPREFVYWSALVMFLFALCSCLTGDLLPWSQSGYFATITRVSFLQLIPVIGVPLYQLVVGGPDPQFGTLTLTRFLFLHVCVFGGGGLVVLCFWKYFDFRSRKILLTEQRFDDIHKCALACATKTRKFYWGGEACITGLVCFVLMLAVLTLVFQRSLTSEQIAERAQTLPAEAYLGAELTAPVDVASSYDAARPEWSFRALYYMTKLPIFSKIGMFYAIFAVPPALLLFFFCLPLLARKQVLHKVCVGATFILFVVFCIFTYKSYWDDYKNEDHAPAFLASVADARRTADRAVELAFAPTGIPKTGALELTQNDAFLQGAKLFEQNCASCHNFKAPSAELKNPEYVEIECSEPTAPNLYGAGTAQWIQGFTNLETLSDVNCFGKTAFADGSMITNFMGGRVAPGKITEDGSLILNPDSLVGRVIAPDASPSYDAWEAVFETFCADDENLEILDKVVEEEESDEAKEQYINKLRELLQVQLEDEDFIVQLDPSLPEPVLTAMKNVLVSMLSDEKYQNLLFDEESIELIKDESYDDFLTDVYLGELCGGESGEIPTDAQGYINQLYQAVIESCDKVAVILAEEAKLDEPRPFVNGEYIGLVPNAISDMKFLCCTDCHTFYGFEKNDHACDLRAYMSRNWIADFIADPTLSKFYGKKNDRMPAYHPAEGDALMSKQQIGMLADWLSGVWYRAPKLDDRSLFGKYGSAKEAAQQQEVERAEQEAQKARKKAEIDELVVAETAKKVAEEKLALENKKAAEETKAKKEAEEKLNLQQELTETKEALEKVTAENKDIVAKADKAATVASESLSNVEQELKESKTANANLQITFDAYRTEAEKESAKVSLENQTMARQIEESQSELTKANQYVSDMTLDLQKAAEEKQVSDEQIRNLTDELDRAKQETIELRSQCDSLNARLSELMSKTDESKPE